MSHNLIEFMNNRKLLFFIPDKVILSYFFKKKFKKKLDLKNPKTFNEKLQWLKLYDRKDQYTHMVDKYEVKDYVASIIGDEYIIPTIGIYNKFDEINFEKLPKQFVIKCTHDSGSLLIIKDKDKADMRDVKKKIEKSLKKNYFYGGREWPYKNVRPRILIEKYMKDGQNDSLKDYKFFCFNGIPELMYLSEGLENHSTASMSFFDMNFRLTDCKRADYKQFHNMPEKPKNFDKMKIIASKLSKNIPHLRVDLYEINGKVYFGELTFYTCSGFVPFEDEKWNHKLGNLIDLNALKKGRRKDE